MRIKKSVQIITLSRYNAHTEPLFKNLNLLKVEDILKLQELKFYFRCIHKNLPAYLLNWPIVPNANILLELSISFKRNVSIIT